VTATKLPANGIPGKTDSCTAARADTERLLDDITALILRYVIFATEHVARTIALFILLTYMRNADGSPYFYVSPYLYIRGRGSKHGKSRVIEIMRALVSIPSEHMHRPTEAVIFRLIANEHCTLFIDEIHHMLNGPEASGIIAILNGGNFSDGYTVRCDARNQTDIIKYPIGGLKVIAGKDTDALPNETISRCIIVDMPHKPGARTELGRRFIVSRYRAEAQPVRERCETWLAQHGGAVRNAAEPDYPDALNDDRTAEAWAGILTLAALAGSRWAEYATSAVLHFAGDDNESAMPESLSFNTAVKTAASRCFITVSGYEDRSSPPEVARDMPKGMGIKEFGWPSQKGAFRNVSLRVDTSAGKADLRLDEFEHFWHRVRSANNGHGVMLADANTMLRQLKADGRLSASGRGHKMPAKVWENEPGKHQIYSIDVTDLIFTDGIVIPLAGAAKSYAVTDDAPIISANTDVWGESE